VSEPLATAVSQSSSVSAGAGFYRTTPDGRILSADPGLLEMLGYASLRDLAARNLEREGFHPAYPRRRFLGEIEARGEVRNLKSAWLRRDGGTVFVAETAQAVRDASGRLLYFEGVAETFSPRRFSSGLLGGTDKLSRAILEHTLDLITILTPRGVIRYQSHSVKAILGYDPVELLDEDLARLVHPDDVVRARRLLTDAAAAPASSSLALGPSIELRMRHRDGSYRVLEGVCHNLLSDPRVAGLLVEARDITRRREAEDRLRRSQERLQRILDATDDVIWEWDLSLNRLSLSGRLEAHLGLPPGAAPATWEQLVEIVHAEDRSRLAEALRGHLDFGVPFNLDVRLRSDAVGFGAFLVRGEVIRGPSGQPVWMSGAMTDITVRRRAEEALRRAEEQRRVLLENLSDGVVACDAAGTLTLFNRAARDWHGHDAAPLGPEAWPARYDLCESDGTTPLVPEDVPLARAFRGETVRDARMAIAVPGRPVRHVLSSGGPLLTPDGVMAGAVVVMRDVTAAREAEEALRRSEERYALAVRAANDGVWDWDLATGSVYLSTRWKSMLGYADGDVGDRLEDWLACVHPDDAADVSAALDAHLGDGASPLEVEHRMRCRDGSTRWVLCRGLAVRDAAGRATRMAGSLTDVSERRRVEEQLTHAALHDVLTGLPNRALFVDRVTQALKRRRRAGVPPLAVLFLDVDRFKLVNDSLGHMTGDALLSALAGRVSACVRPGDTVSRFGGDEFTVLLDPVLGPDHAEQVAARIERALAEPFPVKGTQVFATVSIGMSLSGSADDTPDDLLRHADMALYRAKSAGRARHEVFHGAEEAEAQGRLRLETDLRRAIEARQFELFYQPIVRVADGSIVGLEALIRWRHPARGLVAPVEFIGAAEETGAIVPISRWVLETACRQLATWSRRFGDRPPLTMAVNVSPRHVHDGTLPADVARALDATGLRPGCLHLELTEGIVLDPGERTVASLRKLDESGVEIHIDDFGMGHASFGYLKTLPVHGLKVDRSFIENLVGGSKDLKIVRGILGLARSLGLPVTAEGVERPDQLHVLAELRCERAQGHLFSVPLAAPEAEELLSARSLWPA